MQGDIDHIREIEAVSRGRGASPRDPRVLASWLRCLEKHGLDPTERREAYILPETQLRLHRQRSEELIGIARSGIDNLYKLVAGQSYVLLLSDGQGVTVDYLGQDRHKEELRRTGLFLGAEWSEGRAGTCAVGACIEAGEPLIVHQSDHFDVTHGALSCTAAPIYDTAGQLSAVLDISLLSPPRPRESQVMALNLVRQAARRIEMANIMAESRRDWVLRLADSPDFLDVDPEAALSLDAAGRVIGMTNGAARLMARTLGVDWREAELLIGRHVGDIFEVDLDMLEGLTRQTSARDRFLQTRDGYRLFAHAIEPRRSPAPRPARPRHMPAELRALAGEDAAMSALLGQAAVLAPGGLPLLILGETGSGKTALARAIHTVGSRGPCITVPCETFTEDEAASLFGREEKRSFEPGLVAAAAGGTLVLDNLDELPGRLQARLVRLVAEGSYRPVGAIRERAVQARIVVTLSRDPEEAVADGRLRRDLYLRLAGGRLALPPLRARRDLFALADRVFARAFGAPVAFDADALALVAGHGWAGNLHELDQIARIMAAAASQPGRDGRVRLGRADFPPQMQAVQALDRGGEETLLARHLDETGWNISQTARRMGVNRSTIHRQIRRHGLRRP
ncbi:sigma-54-dependent Fis family transcriptional regulator [Poseidonocella sp. HB161398]|uniref:sigma-54-dependent Fis family transcriptional regulator n=1 Tax=Poseidonocella sp. HB161398 TaxID=2320855 RepID=UPI00110A0830|nr:sigma-54-dependent Fis family transcriptional regulator [Poseidonocella sp. HB161398]